MSDLEKSKKQGVGDTKSSLLPYGGGAATLAESPSRSASERFLKRRRRDLETYGLKFKRLQRFFNYEYRNLLNLEIQQITSGANLNDLYMFQDSQIGSSVWTAAEKTYFFAALDTLGKDNIRGISARIGGKSEIEVREYLLVLQDQTRSRSHSSSLCTLVDIPSASEISDRCCTALEKAADALSARQEYDEVEIELEKWNDLWLVTYGICDELNRRRNIFKDLKSMEEFKPVAELFNLRNWIRLSERIFMNSATNPEENWENLVEPGEKPAIRATAFEDLYSLAICITKRLISATIFCAMSRLRARGTENSKRTEVIPKDVETAIKTLGMKGSSREFWTRCPRRCKLHIVNDMKMVKETGLRKSVLPGNESSALDSIMTYDEVERILTNDIHLNPENYHHNLVISNQGLENHDEPSKTDHDLLSNQYNLDSDLVYSSDESSIRSNVSSIGKNGVHDDETLEKHKHAAEEAEDFHIDVMDMRSSRVEEASLWKILKQESQFEVNNEELSLSVQNIPNLTRDSHQRGDDWRERLEYYSEWETLNAQILNESFASNWTQSSEIGRQRLVNDSVGELKQNLNQVLIDSDEYYHEQDTENLKSNYGEQASDSEEDDKFSGNSASSDETIAKLRGLADHFQPSSDEDNICRVETGS